jgi:hypothetical protein
MAEMERNRSIRPCDEELIQSTFREQFHIPIHDWLLIQTDTKREKLYGFLKGNHPRKPPRTITRPRDSSWTWTRTVDLVAETAYSKVDFNRAIYGPLGWQVDPRSQVPTSIARDGIFGHAPPYANRATRTCPTDCETYAQCLVKKLLKRDAAARLRPLADEHLQLLEELTKWAEKKTMSHPTDPIRGHASLDPWREGALSKAKLEEDHICPAGHRPIRRTKVARDLRERTLSGEMRRLTRSQYQDVFCDDIHREYLVEGCPPLTPSIRPTANPFPFGVFPEVKDVARGLTSASLIRQAVDNRNEGRINERILHGPTCL